MGQVDFGAALFDTLDGGPDQAHGALFVETHADTLFKAGDGHLAFFLS